MSFTTYWRIRTTSWGTCPAVHGADIFERIYAFRLESIRNSLECRTVLSGTDSHGLLAVDWESTAVREDADVSDSALLAEMGLGDSEPEDDITRLTHFCLWKEIRAAEEIAKRERCEDFYGFYTLFDKVQKDLESGARFTLKFQENADVNEGEMFMLDGQKVDVATVGEKFTSDYGRPDRRLHLMYDNGTESDLLIRSFQRALYKDMTSRRITTPHLPR